MWTFKLIFLSTFALFAPIFSSSILCHPDDHKALVAFFNVFNVNYSNPYSNYNNSDCCKWRHVVECDQTTHRVIALRYLQDDVPGAIPEAIGDLTHLRDLVLHKLPNVTGPIPDSIVKLKNLSGLYITWTGLSGPIPSFLGQLKSLVYLDLSFNQLSGSIPPSLSNLQNLMDLHLDRNLLTGSIPESFGSFQTNKFFNLVLSNNKLSGSIPSAVGNGKFMSIDVSNNQLSGDALFLMGKDSEIVGIDLSRNLFEFNLSEASFNLDKFAGFDLSHNKIYGSIPFSLGEIDRYPGQTGIRYMSLNVSYNRLCGPIPTAGQFQYFDESCYMHNRCLCGTPLPPCK